ncbi:hypothetical protein SAMN04487898_115131 [Pedobacter sp. ok626]|uniref:hypothetical protein n=1 Tax=Pedobacter sp. ok626 TaxID=1761882 RepID=UPI0008859056|nr:hypothetical protein [Pedobacter sp. ok626]SDL15234.1 hypothetical protein SAMN04487898_115131 [Pedobacter sp. ok626]
MKSAILCLLFVCSITIANAQQQNYKDLLNKFSQHSKNNFQDITEIQTDTASVFYPCKLKPNVGFVKIGKYPNAVTLNWIIPLAQSNEVQAVVMDFMKNAYFDTKFHKTVSDGTEAEGYITTNVYALGTEKPLLVFQTIYYRNEEDTEKSNFTIIIYGK